MTRLPIVPVEGSAAIVMPPSALDSLGIAIGDLVDVTVSNGQIIVRPVSPSNRSQVVDQITHDVLEQRRDAYQRLA